MPAIQPALLRKQAAQLVQHLDNPPVFVRNLHLLFEFYADRAIRPGQATKNKPLTKAYKIRSPVLRQIVQELEPSIEQNPQQVLELCDALWMQNYLEFRLLAGMLLGKIPVSNSAAIIERLEAWIQPDLEMQLMTALFDNGLYNLIRYDPQSVVKLAKDFLSSSQTFYKQVGLRAIRPIINDTSFENLPAFYRMLQPFVLKIDSALRPDLLEVISILTHRSPQETAFFLRESLNLPDNPDTAWIIRHSMHEFPLGIQTNLKESLRQLEKRQK
ncbi:MAG TPA: DNA alkylation repair protein [Anaerolineales bacterium]|nr:DNA alkylation repair protein [Anaerolineales bacterium]